MFSGGLEYLNKRPLGRVTPCLGMPEAGRGLGGVADGKLAGGSTVPMSAQQNRSSQRTGSVLVQVYAFGGGHGWSLVSACGPGRAA
jgi:hypothetical protein